MVDDATSRSVGRFSEEETIWAAVAVLRRWIEQHGVPLARALHKGLTLQGGINTGRTVIDVCDLRTQLPELTGAGINVGPTNPNCGNDPGFITKVTGLASYTVPKVDALVAATLRSDQGAPLRAIMNVPVALVSAALGRPAAVAGTTVAVDLVEPGQVWGDRVNEVNLRFAKVLRRRPLGTPAEVRLAWSARVEFKSVTCSNRRRSRPHVLMGCGRRGAHQFRQQCPGCKSSRRQCVERSTSAEYCR